MSEHTDEVVTAAEPHEEPSSPAARPRTRRKRTTLISAAVGLAVLAGAGFAASALLDTADRSSPTRYWHPAGAHSASEPKPVPTVPVNALAAKLLPLDPGGQPGPDTDGEGNDFYVSGESALQTFKSSRSGLSEEARAGRDKALAGLKLKGVAGRSYSAWRSGAVSEIELMQADPQAVASLAEVNKKVFDVLEKAGGTRRAPAVDGFPQAECALSDVVDGRSDASTHKGKLDSLECVAAEGDVLVNFRTYGSAINVNKAVDLFEKQLIRLKAPGESA
ncbi:hypothetical protein [Streptomyces sp. NPDC091259]|uniref:hypothetical protein n=1 Tax=Streptomyces sp. NPDC091259 TaxID=3365976 RepID=UPI00380DE813